MIIGTLAGAATLGLMIPPSLTLIVYGVTINESITKLFMAGVFPGLVLAGLFMLYIIAWHWLGKGDRPEPEPAMPLSRMIAESRFPGAASGAGLCGYRVDVHGLCHGDRGRRRRRDRGAGPVGGARVAELGHIHQQFDGRDQDLGHDRLYPDGRGLSVAFDGFTGLPRALAEMIDSYNLSPIGLIAVLTVFYLILGMFMDGLSSVVLTMAIVEPMIRQAGIDVIWFGIFLVVVIETAQVTPPIGFNLFVLQGMTHHEISYIAKTAIPMVGLMLLMVVILVMWPELATWLPDNIRKGP